MRKAKNLIGVVKDFLPFPPLMVTALSAAIATACLLRIPTTAVMLLFFTKLATISENQ